jgi:hypothetical protein
MYAVPKGSQTRIGLASFFGTWVAQHLNSFRPSLSPADPPIFFGLTLNSIPKMYSLTLCNHPI